MTFFKKKKKTEVKPDFIHPDVVAASPVKVTNPALTVKQAEYADWMMAKKMKHLEEAFLAKQVQMNDGLAHANYTYNTKLTATQAMAHDSYDLADVEMPVLPGKPKGGAVTVEPLGEMILEAVFIDGPLKGQTLPYGTPYAKGAFYIKLPPIWKTKYIMDEPDEPTFKAKVNSYGMLEPMEISMPKQKVYHLLFSDVKGRINPLGQPIGKVKVIGHYGLTAREVGENFKPTWKTQKTSIKIQAKPAKVSEVPKGKIETIAEKEHKAAMEAFVAEMLKGKGVKNYA